MTHKSRFLKAAMTASRDALPVLPWALKPARQSWIRPLRFVAQRRLLH